MIQLQITNVPHFLTETMQKGLSMKRKGPKVKKSFANSHQQPHTSQTHMGGGDVDYSWAIGI